MLRDRFYDLVNAARSNLSSSGSSADPAVLAEVLAPLDADELAGFVLAFDDELIRLNRWEVWGAGYVAEGGLGDDGFHYFRAWLIGKGAAAVDAVLSDPDSLAHFLDDDDHENEELEYVGVDLMDERGIADPRDRPDRPTPDDDPSGIRFNEDDVENHHPRTAASVA